MYKEHEQLETVSDDTVIWKYLDLFKYLDLIGSKKLFMMRADKFLDPFDGRGPDEKYIGSVFKASTGKTADMGIINGLSEYYERLRKCTYVSCWHINNFESSVMWDAYSNANGGLVIKSTFKDLKDSITDQTDVYISKVTYDRENIGLRNVMHAMTHKKQEFQDERELRVFFSDKHCSDPQTELSYLYKLPIFEKIDIDVSKLIKDVYYHPSTPEWVVSSINEVIKQFGSHLLPKKSDLYTK